VEKAVREALELRALDPDSARYASLHGLAVERLLDLRRER